LPFPYSFCNSLTSSSLCAQKSRTKIKDSRGKGAGPQKSAPPSQFSSLPPPRLLVLITLGLKKKREQGLVFNTFTDSPLPFTLPLSLCASTRA